MVNWFKLFQQLMIRAPCIVMILVLTSCVQNSGREASPDLASPTQVSRETDRALVHAQETSSVNLRTLERTKEMVLLQLENNTSHPIYVSYDPPNDPNTRTFVLYHLERSKADERSSTRHDPPSHILQDKIAPLEPGASVKFQVDTSQLAIGEYRALVGYWDDENVYNLFHEKWPNLTDSELEQMGQKGKLVYSQIFHVVSR